jgi:hypothetical protein
VLSHPGDLDETGDDTVDGAGRPDVDDDRRFPGGEPDRQPGCCPRLSDPGDEDIDAGREMRDLFVQGRNHEHALEQ